MTRLHVSHVTTYRYRQPVGFGEHRLMFRPRDSHDLRLLGSRLTIKPAAQVRWMHDVFSNSIAIASFNERAEELRFESEIEIEHYGLSDPNFPVEASARDYPFSYSSDEIPDLGRTIERHYPDPEGKVDTWARRFVNGGAQTHETTGMLGNMTRAINQEIAYTRRYAVGVQTPVETLNLGSGTCRDLALLMMEAVRSLGLAARFVSGYLYDSTLDQSGPDPSGEDALKGASETHAWVQVYLPGAGWVEFDPTNGLVGGANLIRIAVGRVPGPAAARQLLRRGGRFSRHGGRG